MSDEQLFCDKILVESVCHALSVFAADIPYWMPPRDWQESERKIVAYRLSTRLGISTEAELVEILNQSENLLAFRDRLREMVRIGPATRIAKNWQKTFLRD